jgi:hypothetical protein
LSPMTRMAVALALRPVIPAKSDDIMVGYLQASMVMMRLFI